MSLTIFWYGMDTKQHPGWQRGELRVEAYYVLILLLPLSPLGISLRLVAKPGPGYGRGKVSILLTSRRLKVYLGEMKNQSGVIYK